MSVALRMLTFITDHPESTNAQATIDHIRGMLSEMTMTIELGSTERPPMPFIIQDIQGTVQGSSIRVFAAIHASGLTRQEADKLTKVRLTGDDLARSEMTFQDFVKFKIKGDNRLIRLAMRNCVN
jgi:hypothetical protein